MLNAYLRFAVITQKFRILQNALRLHKIEDINTVLQCCIILHNMMVAERLNNVNDHIVLSNIDNNEEQENTGQTQMITSIFGARTYNESDNEYEIFDKVHVIQNQLAQRVATIDSNLRDETKHFNLKHDLTIHMSINRDSINFYNNK